MTAKDIDKTAECRFCRRPIEHFAGVPGSKYMTPFWRHVRLGNCPRPAVPAEDTIRDVQR